MSLKQIPALQLQLSRGQRHGFFAKPHDIGLDQCGILPTTGRLHLSGFFCGTEEGHRFPGNARTNRGVIATATRLFCDTPLLLNECGIRIPHHLRDYQALADIALTQSSNLVIGLDGARRHYQFTHRSPRDQSITTLELAQQRWDTTTDVDCFRLRITESHPAMRLTYSAKVAYDDPDGHIGITFEQYQLQLHPAAFASTAVALGCTALDATFCQQFLALCATQYPAQQWRHGDLTAPYHKACALAAQLLSPTVRRRRRAPPAEVTINVVPRYTAHRLFAVTFAADAIRATLFPPHTASDATNLMPLLPPLTSLWEQRSGLALAPLPFTGDL